MSQKKKQIDWKKFAGLISTIWLIVSTALYNEGLIQEDEIEAFIDLVDERIEKYLVQEVASKFYRLSDPAVDLSVRFINTKYYVVNETSKTIFFSAVDRDNAVKWATGNTSAGMVCFLDGVPYDPATMAIAADAVVCENYTYFWDSTENMKSIWDIAAAAASSGTTSRVIVGQNVSRQDEYGYFYSDGVDDQVTFRAALAWLYSKGGGEYYIQRAQYNASEVPYMFIDGQYPVHVTGDYPNLTIAPNILKSDLGGWALIWINETNTVEIDHLILDANAHEVGAPPNSATQNFTELGGSYANPDQFGSAITVLDGGKFWTAGYRDGNWTTGLNFHDLIMSRMHVCAISVNQARQARIDYNTIKNVDNGGASSSSHKGIVVTFSRWVWTTHNYIDIREVTSTTFESGNNIFGFGAHAGAQTGVEHWVCTDNELIGNDDSSIEMNGVEASDGVYHKDLTICNNVIMGRNILLSYGIIGAVVDGNVLKYYAQGVNQGAAMLTLLGGTANIITDVIYSNNLIRSNTTVTGADTIREFIMVKTETCMMRNILIEGNMAINPGPYGGQELGYGIAVDGDQSNNGAPAANYFENVVFRGNFVENATSRGMAFFDTHADAIFIIEDNDILNTGWEGGGNTEYSIYIEAGGTFYIYDNTLKDYRNPKLCDYGVYAAGGATIVMKRNDVNCTTGCYLSATAKVCTLQDNDWTGCTTALNNQGAEDLILNEFPLYISAWGGSSGVAGVGRNLDGNTEWLVYSGALPNDVYEVESLRVLGRCNNAAHATYMGLNITTQGGGDNEPLSTHADAEAIYNSTTFNFGNWDVIVWEPTGMTGMQGWTAGDFVAIKLERAPAKTGCAATDADFGNIIIEYLKGRP